MVSLVAVTIIGFNQLDGLGRWFLITATMLYFLGVQVPTFVGNVPLNNRLQTLDSEAMEEANLSEARRSFEEPWNRLNLFRTGIALVVSVLLILVRYGA